ncbi:hypothetical protein AOL_s00083g392 [Orbilia oligospora ATCC 24927]|uniref:Small RNA 2'-O-methyltransferase n=1 Tax=Arthrobotrys oligospora (strain ATCC 24927 / CBS 115.81 / DSM 1491) TaxID=756982 RepID=G1XHB1_ARTOA|nr:hypothetical protein AOL_s00083g392 [Orbilia oligospora ATCC 24927]EGX47456.1 hypothetical protein AOL_s00083g392 [Orbilia oligospora ATCC 24927]
MNGKVVGTEDSVHSGSGFGSATSDGGSSISYGIPSPPSTPPCIKFNPPLSVQRRVKVLTLLKEVSKYYEGPIQSLLEVGCGGNTPLMQTLLSCDDELPLSLLSGIDVDEDLISTGIETAFTTVEYGGDDRWRDLTVSLVHGSFEDISLPSIGTYDAITSCEVIEHLDPGPLANFAPTLLGRMNPKVLIVTTPNRDFNSLFEMPFESADVTRRGEKPYVWHPNDDPQVSSRRYYRAPHTYAMRHHDHRFEWTRQEFQTWGNTAAETFGYTVNYHGCGALHDGAEILASRWRVDEALRKQIRGQNIVFEDGQSMGTDLLLEAFGHCSQVAIFIRNDVRKKSQERISSVESRHYTNELTPMNGLVDNHIRLLRQLPPELRLVRYHTFPKSVIDKPYPPTIFDLFDQQRLAIKHLLPVEVQRVWQYHQTLEEYNKYDFEAVIIKTDLKCLWDSCFTIRRTCRFHFELFENLMAIENEDSFKPSRKQRCEGILEFNIIRGSGELQEPVGVVKVELEPIQEYTPAYDPRDVPDSEDSEGEEMCSNQPLSLEIVSTTPTITSMVYWHTKSPMHPVCEDIYLHQGPLSSIPKHKTLILDGPVEVMKQYEKRLKDPESFQPPVLTSIPVTLVFLRPEIRAEAIEEFDYEEQRREMQKSFGETLYESEKWPDISNLKWDVNDSIGWGDDSGAEVIDWS